MIKKKNLLYLSLFFALILVPMRPLYVHGASGYGTSENKKGQNESLKQSAVNMMEAILNITNTDGNSIQPSNNNNDDSNRPDGSITTTPYTNRPYTKVEYETAKAQYAENVTSIIHSNCNSGVVSRNNRSCLTSLEGTMAQS